MMRSRELDKIIKADEKRLAKEVKLLLLGTIDFHRHLRGPHTAANPLVYRKDVQG